MKTFVILSLLASSALRAATPEQLDAMLQTGEKVTIIDLRPTDEYQLSHIAGAINIPHQLVPGKRLPPLGRVVAYCDGLGSTYTAECVAALNAKPGIQAEGLEGGYAAWKTFTNVTADTRRVTPDQPKTITYEELKATRGEGVVLVDARKPQTVAGKPRVNLAAFRQQNLPKATSMTNPSARLRAIKGKAGEFSKAPSLFVVVDDDHQSALAAAERIRAMGYQRVVVLAGGEDIIRRDGRPGLGRQGGAAPVTLDPELVPPPAQPK
ncbi:MAG TPA: rhodanese-like domain-containing protein [Prosthecobacter sp.]|nr:rhodanese-like domain-containing protein [Prosthecobacter sp.]HRK12971.1 rhodanese-like domain-containing protein [Prosthecobacter sp.]